MRGRRVADSADLEGDSISGSVVFVSLDWLRFVGVVGDKNEVVALAPSCRW